ncbi:urease accessory protein UreD [Alphaproteobacteria bacterium]|nr:urease accessory protein UreD [Alphaproteobacteria bacterium]|tara:strand:- start:171 stop:965 length:795 start_codon:yes stop_codon:yes gene_type:complete
MLKKLQRSNGSVNIELYNNQFKKLFQSGCSKILNPNSYNENNELVFINTAGGITCNDNLESKINLVDSDVSISTQAAEKIYAGIGNEATIDIDISLRNSNLYWLPKELILFDKSKLKRRISLHLDINSNVLFCETSIFGRKAMSERIHKISYSDIWKVFISSKIKHVESINMTNNVNNNLNNKFTLNNNSAISTILIFGPIVEVIKNDLSKIVKSIDKINCEFSIWDNKLIIRSIAYDNYELKKTLNFILENIIYDKLPKSWYL